MIIETSNDIFWVALSFSIVLFTLFVCWSVYYIAQILKKANRILDSVTSIVEKIDGLIEFIKDKIGKSIDIVSVIVNSATKISDYVDSKSSSRRKGRSRKFASEETDD